MRTFFNDLTFIDHNDPVCRLYCGQAMGDQDAGTIFEDQVQSLLDLPLCKWIDAGCGLIQNKDCWVLDQHPE